MIERIPPQNEAYERAILGACLMVEESAAQAVEALRAEDFANYTHRRLFSIVEGLHRKGDPIDRLTVLTQALEDQEVQSLVFSVLDEFVTSGQTAHYIGEVAKLAERRRAISACHTALDDLHNPDVEDAPSRALGHIMGAQAQVAGKAVEIGVVAESVVESSRQAMIRRDQGFVVAPAMTTGFYDLDQMYTASRGDYIVLAARPSAGKTSLLLQILLHVAGNLGGSVYFASLEMDKERITRRMLAQMTGISSRRQVLGLMTDPEMDRLGAAAAHLQTLSRFYIDDRAGLTVAQVMAAAQVHQGRHGLDLWAIDHMSLMAYANPKAGAYEGMTQISKGVKTMGRRLRAPGIAVAQLSRDAEKNDRKPKMSDLRDSGSIEQDADLIAMLHRPDRQSLNAEAELCIVKNRDGACGDLQLFYDAERTLFSCVGYQGGVT